MIKSKTIPILYEKKENCSGCTACYAICPKEAISMVEDEEGFEYPQIQQIMDETGLKKSSVHGYLPYIKGNYNLPEVTLDAEYSRVYRKRISVCE